MIAGGKDHVQDLRGLDGLDHVQLANELAYRFSLDPEMRRWGGIMVQPTSNVPQHGSRLIAQWLRENVVYLQESPGIELLQGPYATLRTRTGDCDDNALAFAAIGRAVGLDNYMVGVSDLNNPTNFYHAIGYDRKIGRHYDTIDDYRYSGRHNRVDFTPGKNAVTVFYSPAPGEESFYVSVGGSPYRATTREELEGSGMTTRASMGRFRPLLQKEVNPLRMTLEERVMMGQIPGRGAGVGLGIAGCSCDSRGCMCGPARDLVQRPLYARMGQTEAELAKLAEYAQDQPESTSADLVTAWTGGAAAIMDALVNDDAGPVTNVYDETNPPVGEVATAPPWGWIVAGVAVLGTVGYLAMRK